MSVGFSIGDIQFVVKVIKGAVFVFTASPSKQYQDLVYEVGSLEATLAEIQSLQCAPGQYLVLSTLKSAAQQRKRYIYDLNRKLNKFRALSNVEKTSRRKKLIARLRWSFTMADDVRTARNELVMYGIELRMQQLMFMVNFPSRISSPDLQHTWFQAPVKFEDALDRVWPIPPEYSWAMLRVIILEIFKVGPGASKVAAGEYTLFPTGDCSSTCSDDDLLLPGRKISMAMIISHFELAAIDQCPTPNCSASKFSTRQAGEMQCPKCHCSFHFDHSSHYQYPQVENVQRPPISKEARKALFNRMRLVARSTRAERSSFKKIRIFLNTSKLASLTYGKRCRMLLLNDEWPAEVTSVKSLKVQEDESQYANFERYIRSMEEQSGAPELILEAIAKDNSSNVPYVIQQLDHMRAMESASC